MNNIKKILIVDDKEAPRFALKKGLQSLGYVVYEAKNGLEGTARATLEMPDLIIADRNMPKRTGYQMAKNLKAHLPTSKIPIIGYGDFENQEKEILDYSYIKPNQMIDMLDKVNEILN